ncbi:MULTISPECIES: YkuJ family protein [unclassified Jeotgalibaca]|uniref:YkuJ family protein n=1 Tax=unclassified Jeotgalibaca TaxID=2621505 RepID=UPI003FD0B7DB
MKPSQLSAIIRRLEVMMEDDGEIEVRRFEKDGNERCVVKYNRESQMFELEEHASDQTYQFDDLDLVAIEIFELLQD